MAHRLGLRTGAFRSLFAIVLLCFSCGAPGSPPSAFLAVTPPEPTAVPTAARPELDQKRLARIADRLDALAAEFERFWERYGPDPVHGGFHGTLDRTGKKKAPTTKGVIQQARHLYSMSLWYERRGRAERPKELAHDLYAFLTKNFRDGDGEFFFQVDEAGKPVDRRKVLYAQAFAIYALSTYGKTFGVEKAVSDALACFRSIDRRAHDAAHGGYDQSNDPAWLSKGAAKETNTHLHLMESFTALYEATGDAGVRARVEELVGAFTERIAQRDGYAAKEFLLDWTPFGSPQVSYGHDLETAWLLLESARALGRPADARVRDVALALATLSARVGFDETHGGYFEEGPPGGAPVLRDKIWWIQAEAIPALYRLYELTGDAEQLRRLERTLDFIENQQRDREHGGWYWGIKEDLSLGDRGDDKGGEWKASYHELRALVLTSDWMRKRAL